MLTTKTRSAEVQKRSDLILHIPIHLMPAKKAPSTELQLIKEVRALAKEVQNLRDLELMQVFKHPWRMTYFSLWKGMMVGFGSAIGATLLVALLVYILSQFSSVPVLGNLLDNLTSKISNEETNNTNPPSNE